jgi:hypothetical protein
MSKDKRQMEKDIIYTIEGKPINIPIVITDNFRFTRRSMNEVEAKPPKKDLFSRIFKI